MLKTLLNASLRSFRKQRLFGSINVFGLSVGLACTFLITIYVQHELAYDQHHPNADRLYRVTSEMQLGEEHSHYARAAAIVKTALQETDSDVEAITRLDQADPVVKVGEEVFIGERFFYTDDTFFDVFGIEFLAGATLTTMDQVVLTASTATRYFGGADAAVGQPLRLGDDEAQYTVVGVVPDVTEASHLQYDVLAQRALTEDEQQSGGIAWLSGINFPTYLRLRPDADPGAVEARLATRVEDEAGELARQFNGSIELHLQPVTDIHLHSQHTTAEIGPIGNGLYVLVFGVVALIVLLIASINFTNLATARALDRAREVGVRKALGAVRGQLIRQFLTETVLLTGAAFAIALGLAWLLLPAFASLTGHSVGWGDALRGVAVMAVVVPVVALLAGAYPAAVLSKYEPVRVLRGRFSHSASGLMLRRGLVVTQFVLSIILVTGLLVVQDQLAYAQQEQLGFEKEHVVVLPLRPDAGIRAQQNPFKSAVLASTSVAHAALTDHYPAGDGSSDGFAIPAGRSDEEGVHMQMYIADYDFLPTLGMTLSEGRVHDNALPTDSLAYLVNQTAARQAGFARLEEAAFEDLDVDENGATTRERHAVIGIVDDFHLESFRKPIQPLLIRVGEGDFTYDYLLVRTQPGALEPALADLELAWAEFSSGTPFSPSFLDQEFEAQYRQEAQMAKVFSYFTGLAVLIACLGLLGLSAHAASQRRKEIGVRKVVGASVSSLVGLLAWDFARPVLLAVLIAAPIAYLASERWLSAFAYRIDLGAGPFVVAGGVALAVALLTVSSQALRAATSDPIRALRAE